MKTAIISGAGIAGLATSITLSRAGWKVLILERESNFRVSMAGIHVSSAGVRILHQLGINDLEDVASPCETLRTVNQYGMQGVFKTQANEKSIIAARSIIHEKLLETTHKCKVEIRMGTEIHSISPGSSIKITLSSGDELSCDVLIGADGINSNVRRLLGLDTNKVYSGYLGVGVVYPGEFEHGFSVFHGDIGMIGMANLGTLGTDKNNKCLWSHIPMSESRARIYAEEPLLIVGALGQMYSEWCTEVKNQLEIIESNADKFQIGGIPVYTKPMLHKWHHDNIILIGDAAHAYGPGGQGVTMALQDAIELSSIIIDGINSPALEKFQQRRSAAAQKHGMAADKRNKSRLQRTHWLMVWLTGVILMIISSIYKFFGWRMTF